MTPGTKLGTAEFFTEARIAVRVARRWVKE